MTVYLNGEYLAAEEATVSVRDRGFLLGDGVYEVIRAPHGVLFTAEAHLERMARGLEALRIEIPGGTESLVEVCERLVAENGLEGGDATVYLQVTRGAAPRTHFFPPAGTRPTVYASAATFTRPPGLHDRGAETITLPDQRWARCDLKTTNLLPNVLAKQAAVEAGATEAIFLRDGVVTEGASTNVFAVIDGFVRTYPRSNYILAGITRDVVLGLAAEADLPIRETPILREELEHAEEVFLTGTTTDVLPVVRVDGRAVADGEPGTVTVRLRGALEALLFGRSESKV
jgi:D-alanine transaminase